MYIFICPVSPQPEKLDPTGGSTVIRPSSSVLPECRVSAQAPIPERFRQNLLFQNAARRLRFGYGGNSSLFAEMRRIRESANARRFRRIVLSKMNPLRWASFWYTGEQGKGFRKKLLFQNATLRCVLGKRGNKVKDSDSQAPSLRELSAELTEGVRAACLQRLSFT